jgi:solute carrier family 35 protein E1
MFNISLLLNLFFWYLGNYFYNIQNKNASIYLGGSKFAMTIATYQLGVGSIFSIIAYICYLIKLFITNTRTNTSSKNIITVTKLVFPSSVYSSLAHMFSVYALSCGGVTFGQIVKASEPAFSALIGVVFYNKKISIYRWGCLFVIIYGVILSSLKIDDNNHYELDFNAHSLIGAIIANIFASFKGYENKKVIETKEMELIGSVINLYGISNLFSFVISFVIALFMEGQLFQEFNKLLYTNHLVYKNVLLSGITFYGYNTLATMTLKQISPVTQSVANTAKRVIIIVSSAIIFQEEMSYTKITGCVCCIGGVFLDTVIDDIMKYKLN